MAKTTKSQNDKLNVLVFKDNYSSRAFQLPLAWISRLGLSIGALVAIAIVCAFLATKYYFAVRSTSPERVRDLERQIYDLQAKLAAPAPQPIVAAPTASGTPAPAQTAETAPAPAPIKMGTSNIGAPPQPTAALPFSIQQLSSSWRGNSLRIHFAIQYTKGDGGNQQGHIMVLARGPNITLTYPDNVLAKVDAPALIKPEEGEYFSVSRFREVNADFPAVVSRNLLNEAEILIFSTTGQLIFLEKLSIKKEARAATPSVPKTPPTSEQKATQ